MNIIDASADFRKQFDEASKLVFAEAMRDLNTMGDMSEENFKLMQAFVRLANSAMELEQATSRTLYEINKKLDETNRAISRLESKVH